MAPTCTKDGIDWFTCTECGSLFSVTVPATGHKDVEPAQTKVTKEPTCTEEGELTHYGCANCDVESWTTVIEKVPHTYGDVEVQEPTCTENRKNIRTCTVCGHVEETEEEGTALGHIYTEQDVNLLPSCTEPGTSGTANVCDRCGDIEEGTLDNVVELPVLDHQAWLEANQEAYFYTVEYDENDNVIAVTVNDAIEEGRTENYMSEIEDENGTLGSLSTDYTAATCTADGHIAVVCNECGAKIEQVIPALGHDVQILEAQQAGQTIHDCTKADSILFGCVREGCNYMYNQAFEPADEHTFIKDANIVGYKQRKAADSEPVSYPFEEIATCHDYYVTVECDVDFCDVTHDFLVEGTGEHNANGDYIIYVEPTCTETGRELYNCAECGYYQDVTVEALGHTELAFVKVLVEPTCTEAGVRLVECTREGCDYTEEQAIPALGHHWVVTSTEADCLKGIVGRTIRTCSQCGASEVLEENAGHKVGTLVAHKDATCTEDGSESYWCSICHRLVTETIEALDHDWEEVNTIPATCATGKESGTIHEFECTRCDAEKSEVDDDMPAGHTMYSEVDGLNHFVIKTLPTCESTGLASYVCSVCGELIEDLELPAISHNTEVTFNEETGAYELTCVTLEKTETGRLKDLLMNAGYEEMVADAVIAQMTQGSSANFAGIGCDYVEAIEIRNTEYTITGSGNRGKIELKEGCQPIKGGVAYVRITWRYTQANGDTVSFVATRTVDDEGTFKLSGLSVPSGWTCDFIYAEVVSNPDADELGFGEYATYGSAAL